MRRVSFVLIAVCLIAATAGESQAKTEIFSKEVNLIGGYSDRDKAVGKKGKLLKNSVGFEYYRKFADDYGDYLTMDIQARLSYDSLEDSQDAWALEIHNAWLDYQLGLGKYLRLGHFDPAFGLEPLLDTHGTLMQTLAIKNIGYKKDWGLGYRGLLGNYDFQAAAQLGSGMGIRHKDNNFLLTTRIGSSQRKDFQYGVSALYGQVLESLDTRTFPVADLKSDNAVVKKRIGFDAQMTHGAHQWNNELVYGQDNDSELVGYWSEWDYTLPRNQNLSVQLQGEVWVNDVAVSNSEDITISTGLSYAVNSNLTVRLGYFHDVEKFNGEEDKLALLQFYWFGF